MNNSKDTEKSEPADVAKAAHELAIDNSRIIKEILEDNRVKHLEILILRQSIATLLQMSFSILVTSTARDSERSEQELENIEARLNQMYDFIAPEREVGELPAFMQNIEKGEGHDD